MRQYSNFTKINNNYTTYVFRQIEFEYRHGIPADDMAFPGTILYAASEEDILRNESLLEKYVNVVYVDAASESDVPEDLKALRCLDEAQFTLYGQDIIEMVQQRV